VSISGCLESSLFDRGHNSLCHLQLRGWAVRRGHVSPIYRLLLFEGQLASVLASPCPHSLLVVGGEFSSYPFHQKLCPRSLYSSLLLYLLCGYAEYSNRIQLYFCVTATGTDVHLASLAHAFCNKEFVAELFWRGPIGLAALAVPAVLAAMWRYRTGLWDEAAVSMARINLGIALSPEFDYTTSANLPDPAVLLHWVVGGWNRRPLLVDIVTAGIVLSAVVVAHWTFCTGTDCWELGWSSSQPLSR
jgi:hypothetical protein